ncbi:MAG: alanine--glyoxylate aminotransferase family protein [Nitrospirae bacterium]|nr:alanine--glyoxylate aminotransferase family protein [Nitrospirota bacterium]
MTERVGEFVPTPRLLLGPGPSMVHPRVLRAMGAPLLGHLDPEFLRLMNEIQQMLRRVFRTANRFTIALSGTGSAGMEAALVNLVEPGDAVIVGVNGVFGSRMASIVERCGGKPVRVEASWGRIVEANAIKSALARSGPVKAVAVVHAETSTGVHQPLEEIGALCRQHDALFIVDAVTSLGGLPLEVDRWGIDACYSGTQKCLSCPPGLAPLTLSERALAAIRNRKAPCQSWYLDVSLIADYWAEAKRAYHHTAPISMLYALREALRLIEEEGLEARFARHRLHSAALMAGLGALGLLPFAEEGHRLPSLNSVTLPAQVEDAAVRAELLQEFGIEIGGGLGALQGKLWRIGLMGESSAREHVLSLLSALEVLFLRHKWISRPGIALEAASRIYAGDGRKE